MIAELWLCLIRFSKTIIVTEDFLSPGLPQSKFAQIYYIFLSTNFIVISWSKRCIVVGVLLQLDRVFSSYEIILASSRDCEIQVKEEETAELRLAIHTSLYLGDKWLCYLRTVKIPRPFN